MVPLIHQVSLDTLPRRRVPAPTPAELRWVDRPVVLFFGLLRPYKGLDTLLEAWRNVRGDALWIVGRSLIDVEALRAQAPPGVRFVTRFVADAELPAFFRRADAVVLPYSRTERFDQSGVLATALAFAKPTVLSDVGGFGEVAAQGAAVLVPPGDPGALADAVNGLLSDPDRRLALARAAAAAAAGPYSWAEAARKTLELYRGLTYRRIAAAPQSAPS